MNPKELFVDFLALVGLGLITYGCWLIYQPLAFVVSGTLILIYAIRANTEE